VLNDFFL